MIDELEFIDLNKISVSDDIIRQFDCGNNDINEYFYETSKDDCKTGNGVTYILVNKYDIEAKNIENIYAIATIKTTGLNYFEPGEKYHTKKVDENGNVLSVVPGVEIKIFAIEKALRGQYKNGTEELYSTIFFKMLLEMLYFMSMRVIGFKMIYLRSNSEGKGLYNRLHFSDCTSFLETYDETAEECTPMILSFEDLEYVLYG